MKLCIFLLVAAVLPFLGRFQETKVFKDGRLVSEQAVYWQKPVATVMVAAAALFFVVAWRERRQLAHLSRTPRFVRLVPVVFALPAAWQNWGFSRLGQPSGYTEITAGLGGPATGLLVVAAAALFVAADAYWRQRECRNARVSGTGARDSA